MDERTEAQFDELLSDYLDGEFTNGALERFVSLLRDTPSLRARFVAQAEVAGLIGAHFANTNSAAALIERTMIALPEKPNVAGADQTSAKVMAIVSQGVPTARPAPKRSRSWLRIGIAAAVVFAIGGGLGWYYIARNAKALVSVALLRSTGPVFIRSVLPYVDPRRAYREEEPLNATDGVEPGSGGSATLTYFDQTSLALSGDGALIWMTFRNNSAEYQAVRRRATIGKRVVLESGTLAVSAAKQPADAPMHLFTPHADVEVVGTHFVLSVSEKTTRLELTEGRVKITRLSDQQSIVMDPNQSCDVNTPGPLAAEPLSSKSK